MRARLLKVWTAGHVNPDRLAGRLCFHFFIFFIVTIIPLRLDIDQNNTCFLQYYNFHSCKWYVSETKLNNHDNV